MLLSSTHKHTNTHTHIKTSFCSLNSMIPNIYNIFLLVLKKKNSQYLRSSCCVESFDALFYDNMSKHEAIKAKSFLKDQFSIVQYAYRYNHKGNSCTETYFLVSKLSSMFISILSATPKGPMNYDKNFSIFFTHNLFRSILSIDHSISIEIGELLIRYEKSNY